jgi:hypothetical protein
MTETTDLSPTERIQQLLDSIEADSPRRRALEAALDFKGSWVQMAGHLKEVEDNRLWEQWEFKSLKSYCKKELQLTRGEIRKLRHGFAWLEDEAPELVVSATDDVQSRARSAPPVPDIDTVDQLAKGYRDVQQDKVPRDTYEELKRAALQGERSAYQLRRQFKEAVPEHKRDKKPLDPRKHFRKALKALERALEELEEMQQDEDEPDSELADRARKLRDEMFHMLATREEE